MNELLIQYATINSYKIQNAHNLLHFDTEKDYTGKDATFTTTNYISGPFEGTRGFNGTVVINRRAGLSDFTLDFWVYFINSSKELWIYHNGQTSSFGIVLWSNKSTVFRHNNYYLWRNASTHSVELNTWHHFAWVRKSGSIVFYVDGINKRSYNTNDDFWSPYQIVTNNHYISEYRFSTYAEWIENFIPPKSRYEI